MNWVLLAVIIYVIFLIGTLVFVSMYAGLHPNDFLHPKHLRTTPWLQSKMETFTQSQTKILGYMVVGLVALNLLYGSALVIWAIIKIVQTIW